MESDSSFDAFLRSHYSLVRMKSGGNSLMLLYLNYGVWQQLKALKPSMSPRTWDLFHHTSLLFLSIAIQPIFCFFFPTAMYILFQFVFTNAIGRSKIILNVITWTCAALFTVTPFLFYILTLISFKVYRVHFLLILRTTFNLISAYRLRKV
ncbi:hypothetical protein PENTCL1PPCAC_1309, partial [Pristionchus entomophagus]